MKGDFGDKLGAILDLDEAIRLKPDYAKTYCNRGEVKSKLGDKQSAIADYRESMELCQQQGNREGYSESLKQIEKLEKKSKGFWERLFS
jgi:tetratricopeptide (TPR) repeat protein